jgi:hypothetical protein
MIKPVKILWEKHYRLDEDLKGRPSGDLQGDVYFYSIRMGSIFIGADIEIIAI